MQARIDWHGAPPRSRTSDPGADSSAPTRAARGRLVSEAEALAVGAEGEHHVARILVAALHRRVEHRELLLQSRLALRWRHGEQILQGVAQAPCDLRRARSRQADLLEGQPDVRVPAHPRDDDAQLKRWIDDLLPLLDDTDVLGVEDFASHRLPLDAAPQAYADFQAKNDGSFKVLLQP
jgi:hypothetical protein